MENMKLLCKNSKRSENLLDRLFLKLKSSLNNNNLPSPSKKKFLLTQLLNSRLLKKARLLRKNNVKTGETNMLLTRTRDLRKLVLLSKLKKSLLLSLKP